MIKDVTTSNQEKTDAKEDNYGRTVVRPFF